jgi:hypothetical protein
VLRPWLFCCVPHAIGRWLFSFFHDSLCANVCKVPRARPRPRLLLLPFWLWSRYNNEHESSAPALSSLPSLVFWPRKFPNWISKFNTIFCVFVFCILFLN